MKESDITQPVIDKCKQIAELWRMEIYVGCWIIHRNGDVPHIVSTGVKFYENEYQIPIPSISDCLEKLRELKCAYFLGYDSEEGYRLGVYKEDKSTGKGVPRDGIPEHEALLSALLEVLKND